MSQTQLYAETNEATACALAAIYEQAFEENALPVSAFENPENVRCWIISVYCDNQHVDFIKGRMETLAGVAGYKIAIHQEDIPDIDWVAATLRDLAAVRAGRYIVHGSHEIGIARAGEIPILIDAGLAFGTGHHGTTAGCLDMLARVCKRRRFSNILDLGTGSGVLAIAAAKTMPCHVLASDIDPVATQTAASNANRNGVHARVKCITSTGFSHRTFGEQNSFDLVMANILAKPLQAMARELVLHTSRGGTVILSGLLPHQKAPLIASFRLQGLFFERAHIRDGWLTLVFEKA